MRSRNSRKKMQDIEIEIKQINIAKLEEEERKSWEARRKNSKEFYWFARKKSCICGRIGPFVDKKGSIITEPECESLAKAIINSFTKRDMNCPIVDEGYESSEEDVDPNINIMDEIYITDQEVEDAISSMDKNDTWDVFR